MMIKFERFISLLIVLSLVMMVPTTTLAVIDTTYALGDVDGDGYVTATDALATLQFTVGKISFHYSQQEVAADVDGNGVVNATDSLLVLQRSVGKIAHFPIEDPSEVEPPFVDTTPEVVKINSINFPDDEFFMYVYQTFDLDEDLSLSEYEISQVTEIYIGNYVYIPEEPSEFPFVEATTLKGIEFFTELEVLSCPTVPITELDVSKNTKLKILDCTYIKGLTGIDVSNNPLLKELRCGCTAITELDLKNNPLLEKLDCSYTGITELNLSENVCLDTLSCIETDIETLDLSENVNLRVLYCGFTNITALDLSNNTNLMYVSCDDDVELIGYTK